tara:strand:- start:836 stop:1126 length:291 start_codon:yes stop_codon:yes gene_type:complete
MFGLFVYRGYEYERVLSLVKVSTDYSELVLESANLQCDGETPDARGQVFGDLQCPLNIKASEDNFEFCGWCILDLTKVTEPEAWFKAREYKLQFPD